MAGHGQVRGPVEEGGAAPSHLRWGLDGVVQGVHLLDNRGTGLLNVQGQRVLVFAYQDVQGTELGSEGHLHVEGHYVRAGRRAVGNGGPRARVGSGRELG